MPEPLLFTKLYIPPPRPKFVPRPRLVGRLNEGLGCKLTLVSAPAGFGKTSLVSQWLADLQRPAAWLSLDEGDNDPARFLAYLAAALQTMDPNVGKGAVAMLQGAQPAPTEAFLATLLNEIAAIPDPFLFILDDYHVINAKAVDEALAFLLGHMPPQMHLVIASREDPPLPLARLRARGQLTELRAADLRFTPAEAAEFLNTVMGLNLSAEDISALEARTEGWISGLQLAGLSIQTQTDTTHFIQSFTGSHRFVLDYLVEEVLQQQPAEVQTFLLRTSILERLCGPLCDAVLDEPAGSGQATLEAVEHANLFIVSFDNERRWFRYHQLFRDLLRQRLGQGSTPAEIAGLHIRASQWHEKGGILTEAFQHAVAAGDFRRAARLAEQAWEGMDGSFQSAAWLGWVSKLPEDEVRVRPVLSTQMGMAFMDAGKPEASEARLQDAERCLDGLAGGMVVVDEAQLKPLPAMIAMARAYNAQVQGNLAATVKYAELALQHIPEDDLFRRAQATIMLEITHWARGDLESARSAMGDWMDSMQKAGNFTFVVASAFAMADILVEQGRLREAEKTYRQSLQMAAEHGSEAQQVTAHHVLGLALLYHEMGQDAASAEQLQKAREMGEQTTLVDWAYRWHLARARLMQDAGDLEGALAQLDEAGHVYVKNPVPDTRPIGAQKARLYLKQGRLTKALAWAYEERLSDEDELSYLREFEHITLARVMIVQYQLNRNERPLLDAIQLLERLREAAEGQGRMGSVIEILVTLALAHQAYGSLLPALTVLERALSLAEPEGYIRIFMGEGEPMQSLLSDFRAWIKKQTRDPQDKLPGYADKVLDAFARLAGLPQAAARNQKSTLIEPLSQRELQVLRLIALGLSNREIGERIFLALSTVKGHTRCIFDKLQVQNRTEAVARARELDLL